MNKAQNRPINFDFENVTKTIVKHKKLLTLGFVVILLFYLGVSEGIISLTITNVLNPGFEGVKVNAYGVNFKDFGSGWIGTNTIHIAGNAEPSLVNHNDITSSDNVYWGSNSASDLVVVHDFASNVLGLTTATRTQLETRIEPNIPLASFNYQTSTPLNISGIPDWDKGQLLQYWTVLSSSVVSGNTNTTTYTATSQDMLLIPGNFHLEIKMPSGQANAGTDSKWQEGSWGSVEFWYVLYWYQWLNAFGQLTSDNEVPPQIPSYAVNNRDLGFNLSGGLPIAGWIAGYQIPITITSVNGQSLTYDALTYSQQNSANQNTALYSSSVVSQIGGSVSLSPSLQGSPVDLYTQPSDQYQLPTWGGTGNLTSYANIHSPDAQTILPTQYFKITVNSMSTITQGVGGWLGIGQGWNVYYPTANYLLRFVFGVYGTHTYVWDVQTALQQGYNATQNYPSTPTQWQNSTTVAVQVPSSWPTFDWNTLFSPFNLELFAIAAIVIIALVTIFNPGVWSNILSNRKQGRVQSPKARGRKTPR